MSCLDAHIFATRVEMPLDQSDRIRKLQEITIFQGWAIQQQTLQPNKDVSSCQGFISSTTLRKFNTYEYANQVIEGRPFFSTCQTLGH
jgi:hypothetical protein